MGTSCIAVRTWYVFVCSCIHSNHVTRGTYDTNDDTQGQPSAVYIVIADARR